MLSQRRTTNILLLFIVVPLVFYLLKTLKFIFIPLVFSMFVALFFLPLLRGLRKRKVPKYIAILLVILIILGTIVLGIELIQLSSKQIMASKGDFIIKAQEKINLLISALEETFGVTVAQEQNMLGRFVHKDNIVTTVGFLQKTLTMILMTAFFVVLWLAESINVQKLINATILKQKHTSIKTFMKAEKDLITFIKVKVFVSLLTGIFTGLACVAFDVSFPIFWGLFAFVINFVQMVGSFISVISLSIFALVELDPTSTLFFFILAITGVQVLFGAILEPIFMGKSFSINIITVLVMLMLWGYIWGVPGLIMAIPITVFLKIIFEQFPSTKKIADMISEAN